MSAQSECATPKQTWPTRSLAPKNKNEISVAIFKKKVKNLIGGATSTVSGVTSKHC